MAHYRMDVIIKHTSLLPRDNSVNVLWFEVNAPDTLAGTMDDVALGYQARGGILNAAYGGMTIKAYTEVGGAPLLVKDYALAATGGNCPTEVALCLSYSATDNSAGAPRFRGRIYLPVFAAAFRPSLAQRDALLALGQALGSAGNFGNSTWKMRSTLGTGTKLAPEPVFRKIESISVDDEWDTQRRRGMRATLRTRQDVQ